MKRPLIKVAPNGARRGKADHPALPVAVGETVATAMECHRAGADALHLHIRDDAGRHSLDAGRYAEALQELNQQTPQMRVQVTTESAGLFDVTTQRECLETLRPDWASVSVREIARDPDQLPLLYHGCAEHGTEIQHILYDMADFALLQSLWAQGSIPAHQRSMIFVLGRYATGQMSQPQDLAPFLPALPHVDDWMVCAFGPMEHACLIHAAKLGGNIRVGFENSLTDDTDTPWPDNATSVAALCHALKTCNVTEQAA